MLELALSALAQSAVSFIVQKSAEGAVQAAGQDVYKATLQRLRGFFDFKFGGSQELKDADKNPTALVSILTQELERDIQMRDQVISLVQELQKLSEVSNIPTQSHNQDSVVGNSFENSDFSGNNINASGLHAENNTGTVNIGGKVADSFRR